VALVVERLDRPLVIAARKALVDGLAEAARVIAHRCLAEAKLVSDLPAAEALAEKLANPIPCHERMFARPAVGTAGDVAYTSRPQRRRPPILCGLV
jgi:hypothetical protein